LERKIIEFKKINGNGLLTQAEKKRTGKNTILKGDKIKGELYKLKI